VRKSHQHVAELTTDSRIREWFNKNREWRRRKGEIARYHMAKDEEKRRSHDTETALMSLHERIARMNVPARRQGDGRELLDAPIVLAASHSASARLRPRRNDQGVEKR